MHKLTPHRALFAGLVGIGAWAVGLYFHILRLPFFRDDMVMLLWLRDRSWGRLWVDATGFPYYRPLSFSTLKLSELFFGIYQPQFLHLVNLFFHTANSVLLSCLTWVIFGDSRPRGRTLAALAAGLLYAAYPFTFEVMPTTGPIFQLQAAFFALLACLAYARWRQSVCHRPYIARRLANGWLYLALAAALLGSFTCEYSVIIPPLLIVTEVALWWSARRAQTTQPDSPRPPATLHTARFPHLATPLSFFSFTILYLVAWLLVPKTRSTLPWLWLRDLGHKTLYYVQGLTYPLQPAARPLAIRLGLQAQTDGGALSGEWTWPVVAALAGLALLGLGLLFARRQRLDVLLFGLAWWAISLAPMWPTLNWDYTWNGPRLHYIPALGTCLVWGGVVGLLATAGRRWIQVLGSLLVLGVALAPGLAFLHAQAQVVLTGGQIVGDVVHTVRGLPPGESALVVNFPSWISPPRPTYAIGAEGLTFLPGYSDLAELVEINAPASRWRAGASPSGANPATVTGLTFTNVWQPWPFDQRFYIPPSGWDEFLPRLRAAGRVFEVRFEAGHTWLDEAGYVRKRVATSPPLATFGPVSLETASFGPLGLVETNDQRPAGRQAVTLVWSAQDAVGADWTVFLHVYGSQANLVAQADGDPLLGLYPLWAWQAGERISDIRYVTIPAGGQTEAYRLGVGLYDRNSGARIPAWGRDGQRLADDLVPLDAPPLIFE